MPFDHFPELRQLRAFDAIARLRSLIAASSALHISQPAVTYLVKEFEAKLGTRIFLRTARGTHLTPAGELLSLRSGRFFAQLRAAIAHLVESLRLSSDEDLIIVRLTRLQCRVLLTVWDAGGVAQASQILRVQEQAVARALRSLEQLCGAPFFEHGSLRGRLIPEAQEFARRLALAGQEFVAFVHELERPNEAGLRSLRIGVLVLAPRLLLARVVEEVSKLFPSQSAEIIEGSYDDLVVQLRNGRIDLIFGALRAPPPFDDLHEEGLFLDPYVLACRRDHPLTGRPVTVDLLKTAQFIMPTVGLRRGVMLDFFSKLGLDALQQTHTNWLPSITALLRVSDRLAILSHRQLAEISGDELRRIEVQLPYQGRTVGLTTRADWLPTQFQASFTNLLRREAECEPSVLADPAQTMTEGQGLVNISSKKQST